MKGIYREIRALRAEIGEISRRLCGLECEMRRLRRDKLDETIDAMRRSARDMLRLSRGL